MYAVVHTSMRGGGRGGSPPHRNMHRSIHASPCRRSYQVFVIQSPLLLLVATSFHMYVAVCIREKMSGRVGGPSTLELGGFVCFSFFLSFSLSFFLSFLPSSKKWKQFRKQTEQIPKNSRPPRQTVSKTDRISDHG